MLPGIQQSLRQSPSSCIAVHFVVVNQGPGVLKLCYNGLLRVDSWDRTTGCQKSDTKTETMKAVSCGTKCTIIVTDMQTADAPETLNGRNILPSTPSEINPDRKVVRLEYKPPFDMYNTLAHYTLQQLIDINSTALFAAAVYALCQRHLGPAEIAGVVLVIVTWLLLISGPAQEVKSKCRTVAWLAHYDTMKAVRWSKSSIYLNDAMEQWDACIDSNFPAADSILGDFEERKEFGYISPQTALTKLGSFTYYLLQSPPSADVTDWKAGRERLWPHTEMLWQSMSEVYGLRKPTLKSSLAGIFFGGGVI